ncbi:ash family protein [Salmonella enterica]|nr:ash family protein [Salmonella enterica]
MATTPTSKHPKSAIPQLSYDCRRKRRCSRKKHSKKSLRRSRITGYSHSVAANSATGLRIPNDNSAPEHAAKACFLLPDAPRSMAVRAGASSEAPGSELPGNANPVRAATNGFASVDGSEKSTNSEAATMATTPTPKHPKSAIPQLSYDCRRKRRCSRKKHSKKSLRRSRITGYSHSVAANSATRIGVLHTEPVPKHAPKACFLLPDVPQSMVGRAGASLEAPGCTSSAGYANPVRSATSEIGVSGGSEKNTELEAAIMATTPTSKHPKSAIPQLSYDCRRKLHRAQMVVFHLYVLNMDGDEKTMQLHIPYVLSYIHDDIKAVNKELISLGLFDKAMGKKRRK